VKIEKEDYYDRMKNLLNNIISRTIIGIILLILFLALLFVGFVVFMGTFYPESTQAIMR